jgi:glutamyl-tRNA synthetase
MSPEAFQEAALPFLGEHDLSDEKLTKVLSLVQPRIEKLSQIREKISFFLALPDYDAAALFPNKKNKVTLENAKSLLLAAKDALLNVSDFTNDALFSALGSKAEELSVKAGAILWCVRVAASGQAVTPGGATEILEVLGKDESLARIDAALEKLPA